MGLEKINLDIKMDFTNLKISFEILKFLKEFFLFDFFILSVMVKSYRLSFKFH